MASNHIAEAQAVQEVEAFGELLFPFLGDGA